MIATHYPNSNSFGPVRRQRLLDRRVRLASSCCETMLPKHWSPKDDADRIARMRKELESQQQKEEISNGYYTLR